MTTPNYYNPYFNQQPQPQVQAQPQQDQTFISVTDEQQARNWPIAPGNSLTFKDENAPYIYTKTMISQFGQPVFEKYLLTKEENPQDQSINMDFTNSINDIERQLEEIRDAYKLLKNELDEMKNWMRQPFMGGPKYEQ